MVAALGASFLTAAASFGVIMVKDRLEQHAARQALRAHAYAALITAALDVALRAGTLNVTAQIRSGLKEGLNVTLFYRKPLDPMQLHDWMNQAYRPLFTAQYDIWLKGTATIVPFANLVVDAARDVVTAALGFQAPTGPAALRPMSWSDEQRDNLNARVVTLGKRSKEFAEKAREELGEEYAKLLADSEHLPKTEVSSDKR